MAENKMTKEVLKAAKGTRSVEELQKLAKENGMELDAVQAEEMYARLHPVTQELSDDELDNVTGGDEAGIFLLLCTGCQTAGSCWQPKRANPQAMPPSHRSRLLYGVGDTAFF